MDLLNKLALGFGIALTLQNLSCAFVGAVLGTLFRVLSGFGPITTATTATTVTSIALLLPWIHALDATPALILLAGIYYGAQYGAQYGGKTTRAAGLRLFLAGGVGTLLMAAIAPLLIAVVAPFDPAESFALLVFGLIGAVVLAPGSLLKALAMMLLGLLLAQLHTDMTDVRVLISGTPRFGFAAAEPGDGVSLVVITIGLYVFGDGIARLGQPAEPRGRATPKPGVAPAWPAVLRGTALGSVLILGIPPNAAMALMVGAMSIKGIPPGPQIMASHPQLFWGLLASMWVGSVMRGLLNLLLKRPPIDIWLRQLTLPHRCGCGYRCLFPALTLLGCIGVYSLHQNRFEVYFTAGFALVGYLFHKLNCETAPLLLGFILGPRIEENLRHALLLSGGVWGEFITRPRAAALLGGAVLLIAVVMLPAIRKKRGAAFQEE